MLRIASILSVLLAALAVGFAVWWMTLASALQSLAETGQSDLSLGADRFVLEMQRARDLAVHLADDLDVASRGTVLKDILRTKADRTGAADAAIVALGGQVLVSATGSLPDQAGKPWLRRAQQGALGYGHDAETNTFIHAAPVFGPDGRVVEVIVVTRDLTRLAFRWRADDQAIYFTDLSGRVALTNREELTEGLPSHTQRDLFGQDLRYIRQDSPYLPNTALYLRQSLPRVNLSAALLVDVAPAFALAQARGIASGALVLVIGATLLLLWGGRKTAQRMNQALERRVEQRTRALSREVAERREAEAALKRAQAELVQAGKLSALGQMSAGIAHELNQPLMAIRSFAGNAQTFLDRGRMDSVSQNLARIGDLAGRMGRIIRNLNAFARAEPEPAVPTDLAEVIRDAVDLAQPRLEDTGTHLTLDLPDTPVMAMGGAVRMGQVVTNLLTNALDAMGPGGQLEIGLSQGPPRVWVRDIGPGLSDPEKVFDPFYSTKGVGEGLGLGLSISYGIVAGFGGTLKARNLPEGGAEFEVTLQPSEAQEAA